MHGVSGVLTDCEERQHRTHGGVRFAAMALPEPVLRAIREELGPVASPIRVSARGGLYDGFSAERALDALEQAVASAPRMRSLDTRLFACRGGTRNCAVWRLPPLDIIEVERVGDHNQAPGTWRAVRSFLEAVGRTDPFDVVFADEAGVDLRFLSSVPPIRARAIDGQLLDAMAGGQTHWVDSYTFMLDEARRGGLTPDPGADGRGGGLVATFIQSGRLRFWWD
jgi:hypothetical protein